MILCTSHNATVAKFALHRTGAPIGVANWQTDPHVDVTDELPSTVTAELAEMRDVRDRLTSHVADTAERVEANLLDAGPAERAVDADDA